MAFSKGDRHSVGEGRRRPGQASDHKSRLGSTQSELRLAEWLAEEAERAVIRE